MIEEKSKVNGKKLHDDLVKLLKKLDKRELAICILKEIKKAEHSDEKSVKKYYGFFYLFLLQETIKYSGFQNAKQIKANDFYKSMNIVVAINNYLSEEIKKSEYSHVKIMRKISSQQFYLQESIKPQFLGRILIFMKIIQERFPNLEFKYESFPMEIFLKYSFSIFAWCQSHNNFPTILEDDIAVIMKDKIDFKKFFYEISVEISELSSKIKEREKLSNPQLQIFARSVFIHFPIVKIYDHFYVVSEAIFGYFIRNSFFYNLSKFGNTVSKSFEIYIGKILDHYHILYKSENDLKKEFSNTKLIDYLIQYKQNNLLIEVKGIFATDRYRAQQSNDVLLNEFQDSIIKAFEQISIISSKLLSANSKFVNYAFIVTFDEFYLGDTESLYDEFIKEGLAKKGVEFIESEIPLKNIFIISADDFERMQVVFKKGKEEIFSLLEKLVEWKKENNPGLYFRFWDLFSKFYEYKSSKGSYVESHWDNFINNFVKEVKESLLINKNR